MNYLISSFACELFGDHKYNIEPYCKYRIEDNDSTQYLVFGRKGERPFIFDTRNQHDVIKIEYGNDCYYYVKGQINELFTTQIKFNSHIVNITLGERMYITVEGNIVCNELCSHIEYSHYEIRKNFLIIFFNGTRDYVVVLRDKELMCASYYDEINLVDGELVFMSRCYDSLNHGKVFCLNKNNEYDSYLVYLQDKELSIKENFTPLIFLDCVMVGNYKYANNLLNESIRLDDEKKLREFFEDFDEYLVLDNAFALIKKNTLAGIYKFEILNNKIVNITHL